MDKARLLEEATQWFDGKLEPYMETSLEKALDKLALLEPFEDTFGKEWWSYP